MAITIEDQGFIDITSISADWDYASEVAAYPREKEGPIIDLILFAPGAANDRLVIKNGDASGPVVFKATATTTDERVVYYHGKRMRPFIDYSECTLSTGHQVVISLWPHRRR